MQLRTIEDTERLGREIGRRLQAGDVVALFGDLGVGKTALTKGIASGLDFTGEVSSPTFPIVQVYDEPGMRLPFWHIDLYRIDDVAGFQELGLEEARDYAALVIEWPERLGERLWKESLRLEISRTTGEERALTAHVPKAWEKRWPPR